MLNTNAVMRAVAGLACAASLGCGADASTAPTNQDIPTDFAISVSSGTTPTFSWSESDVESLTVTDMDSNTLTQQESWDIWAQATNGIIGSPVRYGVMPAGAGCFLGVSSDDCPTPHPLIHGHRYLVVMTTTGVKIGAKLFTP